MLLPALGFGLHGCLTLTLMWTWSSSQQRTHGHESERARDSRAQRWHWIKILLWRLDLFKRRVVYVAFIKVDGALIFLLAGLCVCVCVFTTWLKGTASTLISYCLVQCRSDGQPAEEVNSFLLNFCSFVVGGTIALHWVALSFWEKPAAVFLHYKSNIGLQKGHGCFWTKHVHTLRFLNNTTAVRNDIFETSVNHRRTEKVLFKSLGSLKCFSCKKTFYVKPIVWMSYVTDIQASWYTASEIRFFILFCPLRLDWIIVSCKLLKRGCFNRWRTLKFWIKEHIHLKKL